MEEKSMKSKCKKALLVLLSVCMVLTMTPVMSLAEETTVETALDLTNAISNAQDGDTITLSDDITVDTQITINKSITLDLNGNVLTVDRLDANSNAAVVIKDSVGDGGRITSSNSITGVIWSGSSITLESGTIENLAEANGITIFNMGTFTMDGGSISGETAVYNTAKNGQNPVEGNIVCNINGGTVNVGIWGIVALGPGLDSNGSADNEKITVNIAGGEIKGDGECQAIATNASSGAYAGFTINISDGTIDGGLSGCGMYLPAIGVTNISGGTVKGAQAIRIAAGELYVTGGTVEGTAALTDDTDLINGGSGGTEGAIVVGKAGNSGYVGDVIVEVSKNAVIKNNAENGAAVVVSDKNMGHSNYTDYSIDVSIEGVTVTGDIVKVSNLSSSVTTNDGGDTALSISDSTVNGNILNKTNEGDVTISNTTVAGNVANNSTGELIVEGSSISGNVSNTNETGAVAILNSGVGSMDANSSNITLVNSTVGSDTTPTTTEAEAMIGARSYETLADAIMAASDGETVTLLKDVEVSAPADVNTGAINISKSITIDGTDAKYSISAADSGFEMYKPWSGSDTVTGKYHLINISGNGSDGPNVTLKNLTLDGGWDGDEIDGQTDDNSNLTGNAAKSGINVYQAGKISLENVEVKKCSVYGVVINGISSEVTAIDLTTNDNRWGVNVDNSGSFTMESGTLNEAASLVIEGDESETTSVTVNSGTFKGTAQVTAKSENPLTVMGGTFSNSVADYVDKSIKYEVMSGSDENVVYTYYESLGDAIKAAGDEGEISTIGVSKDVLHDIVKLQYSENVIYEIKVPANEELSLPADLERSGYTFNGWYQDGQKVESYTANEAGGEEVTLIAQWTKNSSGGGSVTTYPVTVSSADNGAVTVSPKNASKGSTVTVTVTPDEGYKLDTLTVRDKDGNAVELKDAGDGKYTFTMPSGKVTVEASFAEASQEPEPSGLPFTDVAASAWYREAVEYVYDNGMMKGTSDTIFSPDATTTRGMIVTMLYRLEGEPTASAASSLSDVKADDYYADAVSWAAENSIVNGVSATSYAPDDPITREQMAAILYRYAQFKGYDVTASADLSAYTDTSEISAYAVPAMQWANAEGLVTGRTNTTLDPEGDATRAEIATIMTRFCETIAK